MGCACTIGWLHMHTLQAGHGPGPAPSLRAFVRWAPAPAGRPATCLLPVRISIAFPFPTADISCTWQAVLPAELSCNRAQVRGLPFERTTARVAAGGGALAAHKSSAASASQPLLWAITPRPDPGGCLLEAGERPARRGEEAAGAAGGGPGSTMPVSTAVRRVVRAVRASGSAGGRQGGWASSRGCSPASGALAWPSRAGSRLMEAPGGPGSHGRTAAQCATAPPPAAARPLGRSAPDQSTAFPSLPCPCRSGSSWRWPRCRRCPG